MNKKNKLQLLGEKAPSWVINVLPMISVLAGVLILWVTWFFYQEIYAGPNFQWYNWLQPALMILAGVLCFIASALLAIRSSAGWEVLWAAISIIPLILALRLVIVIVRFVGFMINWIGDNAGHLADGTFFDQISLTPLNIANIVVVAAIVIISLLNRSNNYARKPKEKK